MIPWLKSLLYDPQSAANFLRTLIAAVGLIGPDLVNLGAAGWWIGKVLVVLAFLVKAGDKNPPAISIPTA